MKTLLLPAFIIIALVQWFVPGKMIFDREAILKNGQTFRFLTEPVDPSNPFVGKYIILNFKEERFTVSNPDKYSYNQDIYVLLQNDSSGFAHVKGISATAPAAGSAFVKAKVRWINAKEIMINYPFDKYYMDEFKAPKAENAYREANIDTSRKTWAVIKVWKGNAVTENVMIDNKPIFDLIK